MKRFLSSLRACAGVALFAVAASAAHAQSREVVIGYQDMVVPWRYAQVSGARGHGEECNAGARAQGGEKAFHRKPRFKCVLWKGFDYKQSALKRLEAFVRCK